MESETQICKHFEIVEGVPCCTLGWRAVETLNKKLNLEPSSFPNGIRLEVVDKRFIAGSMEDIFRWNCEGNHNACTHHEFEERKPV